MLTIHQQIARGLERLGFERDVSGRSKAIRYVDHRVTGRKLYLGRVSSLRRGMTLAESVPDDQLKRRALNAGVKEVWP
jgi:hypothetical protein